MGKQLRERMSPGLILLLVRGLWAPSVLRPDWNQTQVSISSALSPARSLTHTHHHPSDSDPD